MMRYFKNGDKLSLTINDLRLMRPNVSFPDTFSGNNEFLGYDSAPVPSHNIATHEVIEDDPVDGVQSWRVIEIIDGKKSTALANAANLIREKRNELLSKSDWMVLPDTITDNAIAYRKALRDIPLQEGFPVTVIWPEL